MTDKRGYIYYVKSDTLKPNYKKIGRTADAEGLTDRYKTYYGDGMKIRAYRSNDMESDELMLQQILIENKISGEIYKINDGEIDKLIKEVCRTKKCKRICNNC